MVQTGGQTHHLAQTVKHLELIIYLTRNHHVKAVGAKIDGSEQIAVGMNRHV
jgi:hypothetical protein